MLELDKPKYTSDYFIEHYTNDARRELAYKQEAARVEERAKIIHSFLSQSILDVGCGTGGFLACFDPLIWKRYGLDISDYALEETRKRGIVADCIEKIGDVPSEIMDVVIMRGTIQHYAHPFTMLEHAYRVLRPGGLLAILATPNTNSLVYKLFGELPALDLPRNWLLPSDTMLENILTNLHFKDLETLYPYAGGAYANPLRDTARFILRMFGIRKPFAYPGNMLEIYARKNY